MLNNKNKPLSEIVLLIDRLKVPKVPNFHVFSMDTMFEMYEMAKVV